MPWSDPARAPAARSKAPPFRRPSTRQGRRGASKPVETLVPPVLAWPGVWSDSRMNPIDCDVLASGGGMAGTVAAIAAARQGARTVLFERHGFLGGAATAGAVGQFVGWETRAGRRVIAGLAEEIVERLAAMGGSGGHGHFIMSTGHRM